MFESPASRVLLFAIFMVVGFFGSSLLAKALSRAGAFQPFRDSGPPSHLAKGKIPTGGGIVFLVGLALFWIVALIAKMGLPASESLNLAFYVTSIVCLSAIAAGLIGLADDYLKLAGKATLGLPARYKFALQLLLGALTSFLLAPEGSRLSIPLTEAIWEPSYFFFLIIGALAFAAFVNGVNFTDGLDGLAAGSVAISIMGVIVLFGVYEAHVLEPLAAAGLGLVLGFFVLNVRPARIFMGDTGSYVLGALVASIFIASGLLVFAFFLGLVYLVEVVSVIIQVASFRLFGKRVFLMSPVHHHFEKKGYGEETIVVGFWILQALSSLAAVLLARP